jgi:ligand-binding sensor domain-containing protein/two-component sensor histidine kinase
MAIRFGTCALATLIPVLLRAPGDLLALSPSKALTQYTRTVWTQEQGLPQDTIRAIAQTPDGYLWLGTDEGLARFDGYDFVTFSMGSGALPSNSVSALSVGPSGILWIGASGGLARYSGGKFQTFTSRDGVPSGIVTALVEDHSGVLWFVSGDVLSTFSNGKFTTYSKESLAPVESARVVYEDRQHQILVGGSGGLIRRARDKFSTILNAKDLGGNVVVSIVENGAGLWVGGIKGLILIRPDGELREFSIREGLSNNFVRTLCADRDGNLWVGTYGGLNRLENGQFVTPKGSRDDHSWVGSVFEDREGDLWVGTGSALIRLRDDHFSVYGSSEGFPSDEPTAVHSTTHITGQAKGQTEVWVGYHVSGLVAFRSGKLRTYTTRDGLASNEVFSIRDGAPGELLVGTSGGLSRMRDGRFFNYSVPDPLGRKTVYDALEDAQQHLWAATASGVYKFDGATWRPVVQGHSSANDFVVTLAEGRDGSLWAGTLSNGLWQVINGKAPDRKPHLFTTADGLSSDKIRSLYEDAEGTLWISTFGGGLATFRDGKFRHYTTRDGLLSDNISHVQDDGQGSLWLSTTRGISRVSLQQLGELSKGHIRVLTPINYGISDGLRSVQSTPAFVAGLGGARTTDGRLWFTTAGGVATFDPSESFRSAPKSALTPIVHIVGIAIDGQAVDFNRAARLGPGTGRIQFRYAGIYLRAPESLRYSYKLEGLDHDWIPAGDRRVVDYNSLPHGRYRFVAQSLLPGVGMSESEFTFEVLPHFFEEAWFLCLCGIVALSGAYGIYRLRLQRIHSGFTLVFEERTRLAREIHDTLAQGFVGISAQLDALAMKLDGDPVVARQHLKLAQKMARHSLTEARRSVIDLRTSELEQQDLPAALETWARRLVAGSSISVQVEVSNLNQSLPGDLEQNILRIAQEAVANAVKHARARMISIGLEIQGRFLRLRIQDDGQGFEPHDTFSAGGGHFGIVGMRERAERSGGKFSLASRPGAGTQVEVIVPLAR